ncbi:MAG: hypothetical protein WBZ05_04465, partial [Desulfobacterales bacterium]
MNFGEKKSDFHADTEVNQISSPSSEKETVDTAAVITPLPQRYVINDSSDGRILTCLEAPNIAVHIEIGLTISASAAHKSVPGTIYLDGVARCEP